jgi:hypothetical protein
MQKSIKKLSRKKSLEESTINELHIQSAAKVIKKNERATYWPYS